MDMPKPGDAHKKLQAMIGQWSGTETMHPNFWDPSGGSAAATITNRWVLDGFAVVQEYEQRRKGVPNFSGHGVIWFDPARAEYVMTWWDSMMGTSSEFRGQFEDDVLTLRSPMPQGGHSRVAFDMRNPASYAFLMEVSEDGVAWQPAMEGRYRRGRTGAATKAKSAKGRGARAAKKVAKTTKTARTAKTTKTAKTARTAGRTMAPARAAKKSAARRGGAKKGAARKAKKAGGRRR